MLCRDRCAVRELTVLVYHVLLADTVQLCLRSVPPAGVGSALGGLGSSGLPDPFTSPPSGKEDSTPTSVGVTSSQQMDYFSMLKSDSEGDGGEEEPGAEQPPPAHALNPLGGGGKEKGSGLPSSSPARSSRVREIFSEITGSPKQTAPQPAAVDRENKWDSGEGEKEEEENGEGGQEDKGLVEPQHGSADEEEEESEWEVERRTSRQSQSPSHAKSPLPDLPSGTRLSPLPPLQPKRTTPPSTTAPGRASENLPLTTERCVSFSTETGGKPSPELVGIAPSHSGASPNTERQQLDAEASERLHGRESELFRVLQRRRKHVDDAQLSPDARKPAAVEAEMPTPRSEPLSVLQMKSVWEGQDDKGHSHPQLPASKSVTPPLQSPPQSILESGGQQKRDLPTRHASKMADSREPPLTGDTPSNVPITSAAQSHPTLTPPPASQTSDIHMPSNAQEHVQAASDGESVNLQEERHEGSGGAVSSEEEEDLGAEVQTGEGSGLPLSLKDLEAEVPPPKKEWTPARILPVSPSRSAVRYTLDTDTQDLSPDNTTDDFSVSDKVCGGGGAVDCTARLICHCSHLMQPPEGGHSRAAEVGVSPETPDLPPRPSSVRTGSPAAGPGGLWRWYHTCMVWSCDMMCHMACICVCVCIQNSGGIL